MKRCRNLVVALGCLIVAVIAFGPMARLALQRLLSRSFGSEAHVGSVSLHPWRGQIDICDISLNSNSPDGTQFSLDNATLQLAFRPLFSRKLIVENAILEGIQIPTLRPNSTLVPTLRLLSQLSEVGGLMPSEFASGDASDAWRLFRSHMQLDVSTTTVSQKWQQQFMQLESVEQEIRRGIETLKSNHSRLENPLRNIPALRASIQQASTLREQIDKAKIDLGGVSNRLQQDQLQLDDMRQSDLQELIQRVPQTTAGSHLVMDSLLKDHALHMLRELEPYATFAMSAIRVPTQLISDVSPYGMDYHFPELESSPNLWLRRTAIRGDATIGNDSHAIQGMLADLTHAPELIPGAMTGSWTLQAPQRDVEIETRRSFSVQRPIDEISVNARQFGSGNWELACNGEITLSCQGGPPQALAEWHIDSNQWTCDIKLTQSNTQFGMSRSTHEGLERISKEMDRELEKVNHFELRVHITATGQDEPSLTWESNLAEPMRQGLESGLKKESENQIESLRTLYQSAFDEKWSELSAIVKARSTSISRRLDQLNKDLDQFSADVNSRLDRRETRLGSPLLTDSILHR